ncbi:MAG: hypothetical protein IMF06_03355 [Proteobacteria bacterium]|nr:hypothetical protein [Pseudomonadota bacterium]
MKGKKIDYVLALALVAVCGRMPVSQAMPINEDTLNYQGAIFTLEGEWVDAIYRMTYWANFENFTGTNDQSYLKALDWKWEGGHISTVSLLEAPGGAGDWLAQTSHQIGVGESVGCEIGGGSNAVCTDFVGSESGLSTATEGDLRWVFEISFKHISQVDVYLRDGLRAAYINDSGSLAAPILSCGAAGEATCASDPNITPASASVPVPGVPALLIIGLAGMSLCRKYRTYST